LDLTSTDPAHNAPAMLGSEFAKLSVSHGMEQAKLGRMHDENLRLDREPGGYFRDQRSQMFTHTNADRTSARPAKRTFFQAAELAVAATASICD
jgi:hypothetical protein